jgi:hypothetical protein
MQFDELIGSIIFLLPKFPFEEQQKPHYYAVKLIGAELSGLWIESDELDAALMESGVRLSKESPRKPVFFLPFSSIVAVIAVQTQLNSESLGL